MSRKANWQGMNWIRQEKRLAIYLRDGLACAYCGASIEEDSIVPTLDHLKPHSKGGTNEASNLVTACKPCNSSRGNRSVRAFCKAVAGYNPAAGTAEAIERRVRAFVRRQLDIKEAKRIMALRRQEA